MAWAAPRCRTKSGTCPAGPAMRRWSGCAWCPTGRRAPRGVSAAWPTRPTSRRMPTNAWTVRASSGVRRGTRSASRGASSSAAAQWAMWQTGRPGRAGLGEEDATQRLREEAARGRFDTKVVSALTGGPVAAPKPGPDRCGRAVDGPRNRGAAPHQPRREQQGGRAHTGHQPEHGARAPGEHLSQARMHDTRRGDLEGADGRAALKAGAFGAACAGHRVLPSANVPRASPSSLISLRGAPDALRTGHALGEPPINDCSEALALMVGSVSRNQGGGRRPEDIRETEPTVGASAAPNGFSRK
jgi:hypothetical protein